MAGRELLLNRAEIALARLKNGKSEKSLLLVGLRGVGKTFLLNRINELAKKHGYYSIQIEAHENKSLAELLLPKLRQILFQLDRMENVSEKVKHGFRVLKSFFNGVKMKVHDVEFSLDVDPETGTADSGDLESDLPALLIALAEAAHDRKAAVSIIIDELQYLTEKEFSALIMSIHRIAQMQLPLVLVGAGLPQLVGLAGRSKSYAERLFDFPVVGALNKDDATRALQEPVRQQAVKFSEEAVGQIISKTKGYPYFIQEWGYHSWNIAHESPIDIKSAEMATQKSINRLDESFFRVRFDRLTPKEKKYIRALAELGPGPHRSGDIAAVFGDKMQSLSPTRNNLIKKGMIYSPTYGDTDFTVPLFDEFVKRVMPNFETD